MNQKKKYSVLECIIYTLFVALLVYSFKFEIIYNEVDNIARMIFPIIFLICLFLRYMHRDVSQLSIKEIFKKWAILAVLSLLWVKTFHKFVLPIHIGMTTKNLLDAFVRLFQAFAILLVITELMKKLFITPKLQKTSWYHIVMYALPSLLWMVLIWLAVFPALMMTDSTVIWTMVQGLDVYSDVHPITYTIFLKLLSFIWNSPACIALFQILLTSFAIGLTGLTLQRIKLPKVFCWIAILVMTVLPVTWLYAVMIVKDNFFTMAMVIFIDIILLALNEPKAILGSVKWYVFAGVTGVFAMLARHNGILAVAGTLLIAAILFFIKKKRSWALRCGCTMVAVVVAFYGIIAIIHVSLGDNFKKQEASPLQYTQPIHHVMTIYAKHRDTLDDATMKAIDRYLDLEYIDPYIFGNKSFGWERGLYFQNLHKTGDWSEIKKDPASFYRLWYDLIGRYPYTAYLACQRLNSIVWYSSNWGFTTKYIFGIFQDEGLAVVESDYKLPKLRDFLMKVLPYVDETWLLWRPAWAMVLCLVLAYIAVKRKRAKSLWIITPMILNNAGLLIAVPFPDTRFVYLNFYTLIIFAMYTLLATKEEH